MAWFTLLLAGLCEVGFVIGLHFSAGFTRLWASVATAAAGLASFYLLSAAMRTVSIGTAYAAWTAIGVAGSALLGIIVFGDSASVPRLAGICLVLGGVVVLRFAGSSVA